MLRKEVVWFPLALLLAYPLSAATYTFELDPAATKVDFTLGDTLHTVDGFMRAREGSVRIDPDTHEASGRFVLDATSAQTGVSRREQKMHEKILESRTYPDIVFEPQRFSGLLNPVGRSQLELHGMLELHGTKRPMDMTVVATRDGTQVKGTGMMIVHYLDCGLKDHSFFLLRVAKEVRVTIHAVGRLSGGAQAAQSQ